ncbi:SPFH domain-containing protein [Kitasatospora sp. NPDC049258]|uniref:SPFH domain-containing protein n=1 Tax=Kitasatospora sp. NPDC049258 TaxID=3155394 RepID=UPI0034442C7B
MDVTREPSPASDPSERPSLPAGATQLGRAMARAAAKPLIKAAPLIKVALFDNDDEPDGPPTRPIRPVRDLGRHAAPTPPPTPPPAPLPAPVAGPHAPDTPAARRPPRVDPGLREWTARTTPGWLAVLMVLAALAAMALGLARAGIVPHLGDLPDLRSTAAVVAGTPVVTELEIAVVVGSGLLIMFTVAGLLANAGGETRVLTRWGRYRGTVRRAGLVWVNPMLRRHRVDVRLRHWRSDPVQVTDRTGTPIVVRLLIVWRVKDTARALLGVAEHEIYLREQVQAVLTRTATALPCDSNAAPGPALRDGQWFSDELTRALAAEVAPAGLEVYSVQPLALDYAPEVSDSMRRRRLAELDAGLRTVLVDDAVEAAALAVRRLERVTAHELDEAARSALMEHLLVAFVAPAGVVAPVPAPAVRPVRKDGPIRRDGPPSRREGRPV